MVTVRDKKTFGIRMSKGLRQAIEKRADDLGISAAEYIKHLVFADLAKHDISVLEFELKSTEKQKCDEGICD